MKISLTLLTVGMIAAAATAADEIIADIPMNYTGSGLRHDDGQAYAAFKAGKTSQHIALTSPPRLFSTNFDTYTLGNVCTDMTGVTMGQDKWSEFQTTGPNRWNIISATVGQALQLAWGSSSTSGASSILWQDNSQVGYRFFTANKPIQVDFDLTRFSNTSSSKKGQFQLRTYDVSGTQTTIGFIMDNYATGTMPSIRGLAYLNTGTAATSGTYAFTLATGSAVTQAGTHSYYTAYDNSTGVVYWGWDASTTTGANYSYDPTAHGYMNAANQSAMNSVQFIASRNSSTSIGSMNIDNVAIFTNALVDNGDCNGNGVPDWVDNLPDCNNNSMMDVCEIALGIAKDCNSDGIPDSCQVLNGGDFDGSGVIDTADIGYILLDFGDCVNCPTDLDHSGNVGTEDIGLLLLDFELCP
ncbi:MAG: hypothetical protein WCQ44_09200 [Opitutaceae bacterium]